MRRCDYTVTAVGPSSTLREKRRKPKRVRPSAPKRWTTRISRGLRVLQVPALSKISWLVHGFSTRLGGISALHGKKVLNLGFIEWDPGENVRENRRRFQSVIGAKDLNLVSLLQFHSDAVHLFEGYPTSPCRGDASLTNRPGLLLAVQTADCVPILLVDPRKRAVAAVHAGWRGTLQRIVAKTIGRMQMESETQPSDVVAAIGPAIGGCCYEVGVDVASKFSAQFPDASEFFDELRTGDEPNPLQWLSMMPPGHQPPPKKVLLDLRKANRAQLIAAGVRAENIFVSDLCTACRTDLLFSYRKEGQQSGRMMAVVGIRS